MQTPMPTSAPMPLDAKRFADLGLLEIARKVEAGERLSIEDGRLLYACPDVTAVGALAHYRRMNPSSFSFLRKMPLAFFTTYCLPLRRAFPPPIRPSYWRDIR